jgi:general stress protein 26
MDSKENLYAERGQRKLKEMVEDINICLFCTSVEIGSNSSCRPMAAQEVDEEGNIWFFSPINSDKNKEISRSNVVQLYFSHPGKSAYLVVNGVAEIVMDRNKVEKLWSPLLKTWFKEGKDDPTISLIKVRTTQSYYWDTEGNRVVDFFKMVASVATGTTLLDSKEGEIRVNPR